MPATDNPAAITRRAVTSAVATFIADHTGAVASVQATRRGLEVVVDLSAYSFVPPPGGGHSPRTIEALALLQHLLYAGAGSILDSGHDAEADFGGAFVVVLGGARALEILMAGKLLAVGAA